MKRLLFACVGNAMRSQMAEGFARTYAQPGTVEIRSGGTDPAGFVHAAAIRAMREKGVDISRQSSKPLDLAFAERADAFVSLCGPLDSACPRHLSRRVTDWNMPDPSGGGDAEVRAVRDAIEAKVVHLLRDWGVLRDGIHAGA